MITLNPNPSLITQNHSIPFAKKKLENPPQKILPLISIYNINAISSKEFNSPTHSTVLEHKMQCVENRLSAIPTLNGKQHLYKIYSHYGNTPKDCQADLDALEAVLLNIKIKNSPHIALLLNQLPALNLMADALLTLDHRKTLTPSQLTEVNLRENIIRELISSASLLPDILLCTERIKDTLSIRSILIDELIQGALRRLTHAQPSSETEMRALLHAPTPALYEKLEHFITNSQTTLLKPLHKKHLKHIQIIEQAATTAHRFLGKHSLKSNSFPPLSTDILYAIRTVAKHLATLARQLKPRILPDIENKKIPKKYHTWLSPHGMEPAVPAAHLAQTLHRGLNKTASIFEKLHQHINRERLSPFPATTLKSFLSLSHDDRIQCLILKKMALPVQDNADKLQRAAADLHNAICTALPQNGYPLFLPATPEAALRVELDLLTEETPHTTLLLAAKAAHTAAQQILNTASPCLTPAPAYAKFSAVVQEYSDELRRAAHLLKHAVHLTEINFRQKSILTALQSAEKTAHDIEHILNNALESVSGVALSSRAPWLRKLDIDLHTHWQGITALSEKGRNNYILCGQGQQGMAPAAWIQYAVLPLLNEAEKLRGACRSLEMVAGSPDNRDAVEKTADAIKNNALTGIIQAEHIIHDMLSEKNKAVYLCYKNEAPTSVSLKHLLHTEVQSLLNTGLKLQEIAWLLSWNAEDIAVRQSLVHIRGSLRASKKRIKDAVETATGVRPHINSTEGMIAKDAAEWLMELKNLPEGESQNDRITALIDRLCEEFTSEHDPKGTLFRLRITLAMRDAEQGNLIWPLTPQEQLNTVKTPKDYTLAWAEKRLTYSMLYNCLVQYTPAALFSLTMAKNTLVSPLRLINLLLTPARMAVTRRAMQKVRPGSPEPAELIAEYTAREVYQAVFRAVSLLSPQLFKTVAATGVTTYGLTQGGEYRHAFLNRAATRLPGDLFWVGGFAAWHQAVTVFHALRQQEPRIPEQVKHLQEILNTSSPHTEEILLPQSAKSRTKRNHIKKTDAPEKNKVTPTSDKKRVTDRLLNASKRWKNPSSLELMTAQDVSVTEGEIHSIFGKRYIYLQGIPWEIFQTYEDNIFIIAENDDHKTITHEAKYINNRWDLVESKIANTESVDTTQTQFDKNLTLIKLYYDRNTLKKQNVDETSLNWWLNTEWENRESPMPPPEYQYFDGNIIVDGDKKYLVIYSHTWEFNHIDNTNQGILKDRFGNKINIINIDGKWYLNDWEQQKKYLYATVNGLRTLSEMNTVRMNNILIKTYQNNPNIPREDIFRMADAAMSLSEKNEIDIYNILSIILKNNPELPPEDAIKIADTALLILLFSNIKNKQYVIDILKIKYLLMLTMQDTMNQIIDIQQMEILKQLGVEFDLETLKENLYQLYPIDIDIKNYNVALKKYYLDPQSPTIGKNDVYYTGIAYCNNLIAKSYHEDNRVIFNEVLFFLTKEELILSSKKEITKEENEKLSWLNIAKYHLYTTSKYLTLYEPLKNHMDTTGSSIDKNISSVLKKAKIDAVKMYYLNQEKLNKQDIHLSDDEALNEYSNIVMLNNQVSEYLETVTAILFYYTYHSKEKFTAFDFIEAKLYYKKQMELFIKNIYTFDATPPPNFIAREDFRPSKDFSSRSDYTQQFNDYIDKGSSEYESKLLTPLLLSQFNIGLEDLSLPPRRWFTLNFTSYDYTTYGWPYHNAKQWPEKLNVIELYNGDYITISEINGNMKINSFKREEYLCFMNAKPTQNNYLFGGKSSEFITRIIGHLPPSQTHSATLGGTLKFGEEKKLPDLLKKAVQQSLHSSLNAAANYQKIALETHSTTQKILEFLVPFYKECYYYLTDSHYTADKINLVIDFIVVCASLESFGLNPKALKGISTSNLMKKLAECQTCNLSKTVLDDIISNYFPKINTDPIFHRGASTEVISSLAPQNLATTMVRLPKDNILETSKFPVQAQIQHDIPLVKCGKFSRYKGIYNVNLEQTGKNANYFIKNENRIYPVHWDKNKYTWRLIEHGRPMGQRYGMPIHYVSADKWAYNTQVLRLYSSGIETEKVITKIEEVALNFDLESSASTSRAIPLHGNIFNSDAILTESTAIRDLTKGLKKAKATAIDIVSKAKIALNDEELFPRAIKLIQIFTNRNDEESFLIMIKEMKKTLKNFNINKDVKLVNVENSTVLAQISPYHHTAGTGQYLSINYSAYQKNKTLIFTDIQTSKRIKKHYTNENFARALIHEFTHADNIARSTDGAGYVELLGLNGKHDVTKLLLKSKLDFPEVKNNADSLAEVIFILGKTKNDEFFLDYFLEEYQIWETDIEKRIDELHQHVKSIVADKSQLSWNSTVKSEIFTLRKEYNIEMYNQLTSRPDSISKLSFDIEPSTHF